MVYEAKIKMYGHTWIFRGDRHPTQEEDNAFWTSVGKDLRELYDSGEIK